MSIPTLEQFNETIAVLSNHNGAELLNDVERITHKGVVIPELDAIISVVNKTNELLHKQSIDFNKLFAWNWLVVQPSFILALSKLNKRRKQKASLLSFEDAYKEYFGRIINSEKPSNEIAKTINRRLISIVTRNHGVWHSGVLVSLRDYLHTDKCERLCTEAKSIEQRLRSALDSVQEIALVSNDLVGRLAYGAKSFETDIKQQIFSELWTTYPVRRKDETSKERLLAYDLYKNNSSFSKSPRVSIIYDLMGLEGVKNALDMRTIERLISGWASASKEYRHKRYIFSHESTGTDNPIRI